MNFGTGSYKSSEIIRVRRWRLRRGRNARTEAGIGGAYSKVINPELESGPAEKVVAHGEQRRCNAGGYANLDVDMLDVMSHRLGGKI